MSYHENVRKAARVTIERHFKDVMDTDTRTILSHCVTDLFYGPDAVEEGYLGYTASLKKLEEWSQENIHEVWYIHDGCLCESEPQSETEDGVYEDVIHFERHEVARIVFGQLISDGGMNA